MTEPGKCPKCGSENLDYSDSDILDNGIDYNFTCNECGFSGKECYDLKFVGFLDDCNNEVGWND